MLQAGRQGWTVDQAALMKGCELSSGPWSPSRRVQPHCLPQPDPRGASHLPMGGMVHHCSAVMSFASMLFDGVSWDCDAAPCDYHARAEAALGLGGAGYQPTG